MELLYQKRALKLYHMLWSGLTKYLKLVCFVQNKPVELPNLAIFLPVQKQKSPRNSSKLTPQALEQVM